MAKRSKALPEQKILDKLAKRWNMICECTCMPQSHLNGLGCQNCPECIQYTPIMSVEIVEKKDLSIV